MPILSDTLRSLCAGLIIGALIIAALVLGQQLLIPLTIAVLLTFILSPIVVGFTRIRLPRAIAVALVMLGFLVAIVGLSTVVSTQLITLTAGIDGYRSNIIEKVRAVTGGNSGKSEISRAADAIDSLGSAIQREIDQKSPSPAERGVMGNGQVLPSASDTQKTVIVPRGDNSEGMAGVLKHVSEPLAQAVLTFLFTTFLLAQYQDLRDRVVRVVGTEHMTDTTSAMSEAGERLSQLFMMQAVLAAGYGIFIAIGLWLIGVPNAVLWGLVAMPMRFVPYIGTLIAAIPPMVLAAAVDPGWTMFFATFALFGISEALMGNVIEPLVLGKRAGISPFAMIATAGFWMLLWGPIGLVLAAPLTMTLIVMGRYVTGMEFFTVLLGDEPALSPPHELYHRLLCDDAASAAQHVDSVLASSSLPEVTDALIFPALSLAAQDYRRGRLDKEQVNELAETSKALLQILTDDLSAKPLADADVQDDRRVLIVPVRGAIDAIASQYLSHILLRSGSVGQVKVSASSGLTALSDAKANAENERPDVIILMSVSGIEASQLRYVVKRAVRDFTRNRVAVVDFRSAEDAGINANLSDNSEGVAYCRMPSSAISILNFTGKDQEHVMFGLEPVRPMARAAMA